MSTAAFADDPQLQARIDHALNDPSQSPLLKEISAYVARLHTKLAHLTQTHAHRGAGSPLNPTVLSTAPSSIPIHDEPPAKKRKLPDANGNSAWRTAAAGMVARDVSFQMPVRKKLALEIVPRAGVRAVASDGSVEAGVAFGDIEQILSVPVPDKATPTRNFIILPTSTTSSEPLLFSVPATGIPKIWHYNTPTGSVPVSSSPVDTLTEALTAELQPHSKTVLTPTESEFVSAITQAHRKERQWHVRAHLGAKEGFIYPLSAGVFFGFKKPLLWFPFEKIASVSYTAVLQRTFNLVIAVNEGEGEREYEFAMLDQADFANVDAYVKRHGLSDGSLAAERKAVPVKAKKGVVEEEEGDGEGELEKAERELQDAEDEEEEDFDPGSGGESDGSGEDSEEGEEMEEPEFEDDGEDE